MKRRIECALSFAVVALIGAQSAHAQGVPVIDQKNYQIAKETAETTDKILGTNKEILTTAVSYTHLTLPTICSV